MLERHTEGPLAGQATVSVLIDADTLRRLDHASEEIGYSVERLAQISIEEAALDHARNHNIK